VIIRKSAYFLKIKCSSCGNVFEINKQKFYRNWTAKQKKLMASLFSGKTNHDLLLQIHPILVKKDTARKYIAGTEEDYKLLIRAHKFLVKNIDELKEYIPMDRIHNENKVFAPLLNHGLEYWYQIFNPRQLLALATLTKYVRKRSQELILKDGELGAAVSLYLCFGLSKMVDFNTILTTWNFTNRSIRDTVGKLILWFTHKSWEAASTARLTLLHHEDKKLAFEKDILPKGIAWGLMALLKILAEEKDRIKLLENLEEVERANLLLHMLHRLFGRVRIDLARYICKLYNTFDFISNGQVKLRKPTEKVLSILEVLEVVE
jgi:hypothetical protein